MIEEGIIPTIRLAHPGVLEVMPYVPWVPNLPCALVTLEVLDPDLQRTMDRRMVPSELFRVWVLTSNQDSGPEPCLLLYDYLDNNGPRSIPKAFARPDAPWRSVTGISDLQVTGFARMPLDIQGPGWLDWFGGVVWGHALIVTARYGR